MINLEINYKTKMPLSWGGFLKKAAQAVNRQLKVKKKMEVSLAFVSPTVIKRLNKSYRGQNRVTDVLSFSEVNEILICYSRAASQAKKNKTTIKREVAWLLVHGLLHLLGHTHETKKKFDLMVGLQEKIIKE